MVKSRQNKTQEKSSFMLKYKKMFGETILYTLIFEKLHFKLKI